MTMHLASTAEGRQDAAIEAALPYLAAYMSTMTRLTFEESEARSLLTYNLDRIERESGVDHQWLDSTLSAITEGCS